MRTESQIKRKVNELKLQLQDVRSRKEAKREETTALAALAEQAIRLEQQIELLEWVLYEPIGAYHV